MYIGRIQLKGFKSFGGSHEITLSPRFTAIVGPNGSGKSNILDAFRWVLGDGHPGRLRIVRQNDLLFQGSISLAPSRWAEVAIQLGSEKHQCLLRRKLGHDEGSSIFVDGEKVRLVDLEDVKRKWRLEGDRFAFIGQGEVAEVIQQRPLQRRMHLEALFGIDVYRKQREDTSSKLDAAGEETARLLNLRNELANRRETIASMVAVARKARTITDELDRRHSVLYWVRRARSEETLQRLGEEEADMADRSGPLRFWKSGWLGLEAEIGGRLPLLDRKREDGSRRIGDIEKGLEETRRNLFAAATSLKSSIEQAASVKKGIVAEKERISQLDGELKIKTGEFEQVASAASRKQESLAEAETEWRERRRVNDQLAKQKILLVQREAFMESEQERRRARLALAGKRILESGRETPEARKKVQSISARRAELESRRSVLGDRQTSLAEKRRASEDVCKTLGARLQSIRRSEKETVSTIEDIRDEIQARGYPTPVRHLLSAVRLGRLDANPRVLADVVTCPPEFSCALSSYLGGRMYWLLVKDIDESGVCIDELKKAKGGRATFLSLERARPRKPDRTITAGGDILGWACDILEIEETWKPCVLHVLGDLLLARTFEVSRDIIRGGARFPVVTLEGDVFQPGGTVSGGSRARETGIFDLRAKLEQHEARLQDVISEKRALEESLVAEETGEKDISAELEKLSLEIKTLNRETAQILEEETVSRRRLEALEKEREDVSRETALLGRAIYEGIADIEELRKQLSETGEHRDDAGMLRDLDGKRSEAALAMERQKAAGDILQRIRDEKDRAVARLREHETRLEETARSRDAARFRLEELGKRYFHLWKDLSGARADWSRSNGEYLACERKQRLAAKKLELANHRMGGIDVRLAEIRQKRESIRMELSEMRDLWEERYPFPGRDMVDTQDLETIRRNVRNLEKALRKLGDVNMGVLSEEESLAERISFLDEQLDDVGTSMEELRRLLAETDEHAGKLFSTSLTQIDARFCDLFKRLFEGGEAHLRLSEAESIWEAGVEVIARPPGKKPQHLGQLSGGEQSLSAISLLFAAMDVAGAPVAVLDEVDAALDEVNLGRFSELAREYSKSLQIICMTHRRATMERADLMYGVTMSEPGLSQVVGVRPGDWD